MLFNNPPEYLLMSYESKKLGMGRNTSSSGQPKYGQQCLF
jgi:hypothetical protein